jgi:hypothetical protein
MDKLSKSSREIYDRAMNFLTSDYAKVLGKNAIIGILSLMLIGGASVAGAKGIDKLQLNLDKNLIHKSLPSVIADAAFTAEDKKIELTQMSIKLIDLLSKLGGKYGVKSDTTGTDGGSLRSDGGIKGKGWASDFKKKFNEVKKKLYKELTSDEAKLIGATGLTTLILGIMGYGVNKAMQGTMSKKTTTPSKWDIAYDLQKKDFDAKTKAVKEGHDEAFEKIVKSILDAREQKRKQKQLALDIKENKSYMKTNYPLEYGKDSDSDPEDVNEEEFYESQSNNPAIAQPTINASGLSGGKLNTKKTTQDIKNYIYKVVTSKEAKGLGIAALTSLIMAGLGTAGYKAHQYANRNGDLDSDFIKSQKTTARLKEALKDAIQKDAMQLKKKKKISPIIKSIDPNYDPNNDSSSDDEAQKNRYKLHLEKKLSHLNADEDEDEDDRQEALNIKLSPLYESTKNRIKNEVRDEISSELKKLDDMFKKIESDTMTEQIAKQLAPNLVDNIISSAVKAVAGKGMKGAGFNNDVKKVKDKIFKIITSPKAKTMGIAALSTLIITALGGLGYHMIKSHDDKVRSIEEGALHNSRNRNFIKDIESAWVPEYKEGERETHFNGMGLKADTNKRLEIASKKITDLIQYARDLNLDKAALFSLITFLLGGVGYGGFTYIKGKARESEPIGYIPEDDVIAALEEYATGKHRMSMSENIKTDTKDANIPWNLLGIGLKNKNKRDRMQSGGDLSKFGEYAKKKEEAEKKAKPFAKKITDWITSDEAKLIGKAAIQYSILTALGLLTAYAGKKAGEKAISLFPKDKSKINDPEAIMQSFGENAPTGDTEAVKTAMNQYATNKALKKAFKPDPTILKPDTFDIRPPEGRIVSSEQSNLSRYLLENPKKQTVSQYLKDMGYNQPYNETILRDDPALATIFSSKAYGNKGILDAVNRYEPPATGTYRNPIDISDTGKVTLSHKDVYQGIKNFLNPKVEESKEEFKSVMQHVAPTISISDIDSALKAQAELEKNRPNLTVKQDKTSNIVQPKKIDKSRFSVFSGTSAPTPESQKVVKPPQVEKSNPKKKDDDDSGKGLKEDFTKTMNKAGDAIYNVITSPQVQGVAGGVTAGLIVSILSMLMQEKRQETLASRRAIANRPPRPPPVSTRRRVQPPPRGDSEFNPFSNQ